MKTISLNPAMVKSLLVMATLIEARDPYTGGHTWRVSQYARRLAECAGLTNDQVYLVRLGALVHDVGKIGVPDRILNKREKLSEAEFAVIRKHPEIGNILVQDHPLGIVMHTMIAQHHERVDGKGYPFGLEEDRISIFSRIISVTDAFDAMTSARPYRTILSADQALEKLTEAQGTQFDANLTQMFIELVRKGETSHIIGHSSGEQPLMNCPECGPTISITPGAKSGDTVVCPACTGVYRLHADGDTYEVEFSGMLDLAYVPNPDLHAIEELIRQTPADINNDVI